VPTLREQFTREAMNNPKFKEAGGDSEGIVIVGECRPSYFRFSLTAPSE
jgi:hypothetical protein